MRIRKIGIQSVLNMEEFELDFGDHHGLHILYGPNEAGKSTLLKLIVDLLFGGKIDESLRHHYDSRSKLEAVLEQPHLPSIHYYRKKRYSKLLLADENGDEMDEALLTTYLGGYKKDQYALLFGFDHERLRTGGESLLRSGGHAGISLFESGGGIQYLQQILLKLEERTGELLDPTFRARSTKLLNKSRKNYSDAIRAVREKGLRGEEWHKRRDEIARKEKQIALLYEKMELIQKEKAKWERVQRIWKLFQERRDLVKDLEHYGAVTVFSAETDKRLSDALDHYQNVSEKLSEAESKLARQKTLAAQIRYDNTILSYGTDIHSANEKLQQYISRKREEIPEETRRMEEKKQDVRALLKSVAPSFSIEEAKQLQIPFSDEEKIIVLADSLTNLAKEATGQKESYDELVIEQWKKQRELEELDEPTDIAPLQQLVRDVQKERSIDEQIDQAKRELEKGRQTIEKYERSQNIWAKPADQLKEISVPLQETVEQYLQRWNGLEKEREEIERNLVNEKNAHQDILFRLKQIELGGYVPVEEDLQRARNKRNEGWKLIKDVWLEGKEPDEDIQHYTNGGPLSVAFEKAVIEADEVADLMRKESDRSAQRANLLLLMKQREEELEILETKLAKNREQFATLTEAWNREWRGSDIVPKSPAEMKDWLVSFYRPVLEKLEEIESWEETYHMAIHKKRTLLDRLKKAVQSIDPLSADGEERIDDLLQKIETYIKRVEEKRIRLATLKEHLRELEGKTETEKRKLDLTMEKWERAKEEWEWYKKKYRHLPADSEIAIRYIDKLRQLFQWLEEIGRYERAIRNKEAECNAFEKEVEELANRLSENMADYPTIEGFVRFLREKYQQENDKKSKLEQILQSVNDIKAEISNHERMAAEYKNILIPYMETYRCETEEDLRQLVEQSKGKKGLEGKLREKEEQLFETGDRLPIDQLEKEVDEVTDPSLLPSRIDRLKEEEERTAQGIKEEEEELWHMKREFEEMNGTKTDAVEEAQKAESFLAEVDRYWNEYIRLDLAKRLLLRAIEQYRRKNESTMIKRAGDFFNKLTLGQYEQLFVDYDDHEPIIEAIHRTGEKRRVYEMSDGTRDQLFLALRLAFIDNQFSDSHSLPLIMDDILVHFDDGRTNATLEILHQMASKTQILYFTHHQFVVDAAKKLGGENRVTIHPIENYRKEVIKG